MIIVNILLANHLARSYIFYPRMGLESCHGYIG